MSGPLIGVLSTQGDVYENVMAIREAMRRAGLEGACTGVGTPQEIEDVDGLVIPGGESTVIGRFSEAGGALEKAGERIARGMPVFGICAGLILLSKGATDRVVGKTGQHLLGLLDVQVERNAFGRQRESFEADISMEECCIPSIRGVFIRAPAISRTGNGVRTLAKFGDRIVAVGQENMLGVSFHPELTNDTSLHEYFVDMVKRAAS